MIDCQHSIASPNRSGAHTRGAWTVSDCDRRSETGAGQSIFRN